MLCFPSVLSPNNFDGPAIPLVLLVAFWIPFSLMLSKIRSGTSFTGSFSKKPSYFGLTSGFLKFSS